MIPLSVPNINGNECQYVKDCLDTGWISSACAYVNKFEEAKNKPFGIINKFNK
jgi:perosamine synthetase